MGNWPPWKFDMSLVSSSFFKIRWSSKSSPRLLHEFRFWTLQKNKNQPMGKCQRWFLSWLPFHQEYNHWEIHRWNYHAKQKNSIDNNLISKFTGSSPEPMRVANNYSMNLFSYERLDDRWLLARSRLWGPNDWDTTTHSYILDRNVGDTANPILSGPSVNLASNYKSGSSTRWIKYASPYLLCNRVLYISWKKVIKYKKT